jgi:hypothetical protein
VLNPHFFEVFCTISLQKAAKERKAMNKERANPMPNLHLPGELLRCITHHLNEWLRKSRKQAILWKRRP